MPDHKTLEELEEENERLDSELSIKQKRALIYTIDREAGFKGAWKMFSDNGKASGINWTRILNRLRGR